MDDKFREKLVADDVVRAAVEKHPMPWRVEADWSWEVLDANDDIVAKFPYPSNEGWEKAQYLIREGFAIKTLSMGSGKTHV
jgi:hypothetical protein